MRRKAVFGIMLTLLLFSISASIFSLSSSLAQPSEGDWNVIGVEAVENGTIELSGNLTIKAGGSLTLRNVTLRMNVEHDGQYGISVEEGGLMFIYNCNISSATENRFSFVAGGSSFVMRNSKLSGIGWRSFNPDELSHSGLMVTTNHAIIEDNIFSRNAIGLVLLGSYITVARNLFNYNTDYSIVICYGHNHTVVNNTLLQNPPVSFESSLVKLWETENNTFISNTLIGNVTYYLQNRLLQDIGRLDGFNLLSSHGNVFVNNNITAKDIPVFLIHSDNNAITGNEMNYGEMAVNILSGVNTKIEGNNMKALPGDPNAFQPYVAIFATLAHNSIMANNTITGRAYTGICLSHTLNSSILNNNISLARRGRLGSMVFVGSRNNSVISNTMSGSEFGIILTGSSDGNLIKRNNILTDHSVSIMGSSSNLIFLNNIYDFKEPLGGPYDNGMNFWYSEENGNYWSHFTNRNAEGNGIGDEPYSRSVIPPNGTEPYVLLTPAEIKPSPIPQIQPILRPKMGSNFIPLEIISNQVMEIGWGDFPDNVTIINSTLFLGREGLVRMGPSVYIINSRLINMGYGFLLYGGNRPCSSSLIIKNSTIEGAFFDDVDADNITIINSTILNSMGTYGISVARSSSIVIVNSTITGILGGIGTCSGLKFDKCLFSGNRIYDIVDYGILSLGGDNITIANNTVVGCNIGTGIKVEGGALVRGNTIFNVRLGLENSGEGNVFYENNVINTLCPIYNWGDGVFYHNNFINYSYPPYDASEHNELSYEGEGNYWSDYTGVDVKRGSYQDLPGSDGIGDTSKLIAVNAVDDFPLMYPYGSAPPRRYILKITTNTEGATDPMPGAYDYTMNSTVQVKAIPNSGFSFSHWLLDNRKVYESPINIVINKDQSLLPYFIDTDMPVADAGPNRTVNVGETVNFDASSSSDNMGIASYEWSFGDGTTGTGETTSHTYASPGTYTVILTVKDEAGNSAARSITITVLPTENLTLWILGVFVAIAIAVTAILLWKRRKRFLK